MLLQGKGPKFNSGDTYLKAISLPYFPLFLKLFFYIPLVEAAPELKEHQFMTKLFLNFFN